MPHQQPRPGNVFDSRYVILETIGKGGMATIYRGLDVPNRRQVALKVLKSKFSAEERAVHQFFTEARVASSLGHPSIVRTFDFGRTQVGYLYIAMELLNGETLSRRIRRVGRLSPTKALYFFSQILDALAEAHARGTIHRDLKPENIIIVPHNGRERVKLLDFGIAQFAGTAQFRAKEICGTPAYMSPEQIRGAKASPSSDLYSAGILLFEMLAGKQPFTGPSPMEVVRRQLKMVPPRLTEAYPDLEIDPNLEGFVYRLMQKKRAARPRTAGQVREALVTLDLNGTALPRILQPVPEPMEEKNPDEISEGAIFSFGADAEAALVDGLPDIVPAVKWDLPDLLDTRERPAIMLQESANIRFDSQENQSVADPVQVKDAQRMRSLREIVGDDVVRRNADRYTLLHVRFVNLEDRSEGGPAVEAMRQELSAEFENWAEYVARLGGLVCYDSGVDLKVLFGYLVEDGSQVVHALEAARALSLQTEREAIRKGRPIGVKMGVANGVVHTDQNVEGPLDWLIQGSEVDFAVRLSRLAPIGGVLLCEQSAVRAQPEAVLHEMARVNSRGGAAASTFLLREINIATDREQADAPAPLVAAMVPIGDSPATLDPT
jgi:serine/threonine protein kinase